MSLTKRVLIAENGVSRKHSKIITDLDKWIKPQITSNGERARHLLRESDFDLLILDQDLPESQLVAITADSEKVPTIITYSIIPDERFVKYPILAKLKQSDYKKLEKTIASFYSLNQ
ncbi:MAG: hypothetical protein Q8R00_02205 [Candidatus Nanoarchaeia archaeon]|nr:hypothetical protein [Candidatus Nanoarchaeia archaeon]